jgi:ATP synthase I chain.
VQKLFKLSKTGFDMLKNILYIFFIALLGAFFMQNHFAYIIGLILGIIFAIIKLLHLERSINNSLDMDSQNAKNYVFAQYMFRYLISALVLFVVLTNKYISTIGFIIGLLSLQISAYITGFKKKE